MLSTGETYTDPGGDFFARRDPERTRRRLVNQLERLGYDVTLLRDLSGPAAPGRRLRKRRPEWECGAAGVGAPTLCLCTTLARDGADGATAVRQGG